MSDENEPWITAIPKDPSRKPRTNIVELTAPALLVHPMRNRIIELMAGPFGVRKPQGRRVLLLGVPPDVNPKAIRSRRDAYRRFIMSGGWIHGLPAEEWMVDIQGTTVTITLAEGPKALEAELTEAHEIIDSIRAEPWDNRLGFRLVFTLTTSTWDSG